MTNMAKPPEFADRDQFGARGLPSVAAIKAAVSFWLSSSPTASAL